MKRFLKESRLRHLAAGWSLLTGVILLSGLCGGKVLAARSDSDDKDYGFSVEAELLPGTNSGTFDIGLDVSSSKTDLEGTVRLSVMSAYSSAPCAFDTAVTLPKDSKKQFIIRIPEDSIEYNYQDSPEVCIQVLDRKGKVLEEKKIKQLFDNEKFCLYLGILSDSYQDLTYLDLGGNSLYYRGKENPIKLFEMSADTLASDLSSMSMLVIDQYHTDTLTQDQIKLIEKWVDLGGVLIVGTGRYAGETMPGLEDYLGVEYQRNSETTEKMAYYGQSWGNDWDSGSDGLVERTVVNLVDSDWKYSYDMEIDAFVTSEGKGAIGVLPYSLAEMKQQGYDGGQDMLTYQILDEISSYSSKRNQRDSYSHNISYQGRRIMNILNNSLKDLNFTILDIIVFLYVILVGPVLYLILRAMKKREIYWIAVPAAALLFVILISIAGRGFEVKGTNVISISVARADGKGTKKTYLDCYNARHTEWALKLSEDFDTVGPALVDYYYSNSDPSSYVYHVAKNGRDLSLGANPTETFQDVYYCALGKNMESGSIEVENFYVDPGYQYQGTITNHTGRDFAYVAVMYDGEFLLFGELPDGKQLDIHAKSPIDTISQSSSYGDFIGQYLYEIISDNYYKSRGKKEDMKAAKRLSALGIGAYTAYREQNVFVMGLVEDYDKVIDDKCTEVSYGCLYTVIDE